MALEVFWGSGSGPSWRVLLALTVKKIPFESRLISFQKGEHKSPEILAANPRGKVPTIRDGEFALYESLAIMQYLDRKYASTPLFGTDAESLGTVMRVIAEHENYASPAGTAITRPLLFGAFDDDKRAAVVAALPALREELARLEARLTSGDYLALDTLSAADLFVFPSVKTLERALSKPAADTFEHGMKPLAKAFPKLAAWVARIEAIPGYDKTYPPHWREG